MLARTAARLKTHASEVSLGRIHNHVVELEGHRGPVVPGACEPEELERISACGKDPEGTARCLECVALRRVDDALTTIY